MEKQVSLSRRRQARYGEAQREEGQLIREAAVLSLGTPGYLRHSREVIDARAHYLLGCPVRCLALSPLEHGVGCSTCCACSPCGGHP
jgi:hypothetical protein